MRYLLVAVFISTGIALAYYASDIIEFSNSFMVRESKPELIENEVKETEINETSIKVLLKRPKHIQEVEKEEPKKIKNNFVSRYILSPTVDLDKMLDQDAAKRPQIFSQSQKIVKILNKCLSNQDLCGQRLQFTPDEYFDANLTPFHRDLNRSIMIMSTLIDKDPNYAKQIDSNLLIEAIKIKNVDTPLYAVEALLKTNMNNKEFEQVIENSKNILPKSKSLFFNLLAQQEILNNGNNRQLFVSEVIRTLADKNDPTAAFETQKALLSLNLNQNEFTQAIQSSCHLKNTGIKGDMWPVVKNQLQNQIERSGYNIKLEEICI